MTLILVEKDPSPMKLDVMGVEDWDIWEKEVSEFDWEYPQTETCYLLEGEAEITPNEGGDPVSIQAGDLVTFLAGLRCRWRITVPVRKHFQLG